MLAHFVRHVLLALQFFTRIPIPGRLGQWVGYSPAMLQASVAHFPAIGALIGAGTAGVFALVWGLLPHSSSSAWIAAVMSTVFSALVTGALHEDGLADTADGLGGGATREKALEIMKDSRIGSYGAMALLLALLVKLGLLTLLAQIGASWVLAGLLAAHVSSRFTPLWLIHSMDYIGNAAQSKSQFLAERIPGVGLWVGLLWWGAAMAVVSLWLPPRVWLMGMLGAVCGTLIMAWRLQRRLHGYTGDGLGATQQLAEIGFYFGMVLVAPHT
jgi:adenosylcobinamide-GDP ribazoletransferase